MKLHIPTPCQEDWEQMTPETQGRFCQVCQKTVIDFSVMTEAEIVHFFKNYPENTGVCGRFYTHQLEKMEYFDKIPSPFYTKYRKAIASVAATVLLLGLSACTITTVKGEPLTNTNSSEHNVVIGGKINSDDILPQPILKGRIVNKNTGKPIAGVEVKCKSYQLSVKTDGQGYFKMTLPSNVGRQIMLEIKGENEGYENSFHAVQQADFSTLQSISLKAKAYAKPPQHKPTPPPPVKKGDVIMGKPLPPKTMGAAVKRTK